MRNRDADVVHLAEGNMAEDVSASPRAVPRSRRPQDTPRYFMHENRETSGTPVTIAGRRVKAKAARPVNSFPRSRTAE
jgi:hypothetical protein